MGQGPRIRLHASYGSSEFLHQYRAALEGDVPLRAAPKNSKGRLSWLVNRYRESSAWSSLAPATRRQRELIFSAVVENSKDAVFSQISTKDIRNGRERRRATPFAANNFLKAMRKLFDWAKEAEYVTVNPAIEVDFLPAKTEGHTPWTMADVKKYEIYWPQGSRERVWLHVLLYTGFRLGDACIVGKQHVNDDWISMRAEKTSELLEIPLFQPLLETLRIGPTSDLAWIANEYGRPFAKASFGNAFRRAARQAGIVGKSAHGLRKTLATHGAECGLTEEELQAFFGWKSSRMSSIYTKSARRRTMAMNAGRKMITEQGSNIFTRTTLQGAGEIARIPTKSGD